MENKQKGSEGSHVELDSRLLSVLLTVSIVRVKVTMFDFGKDLQLFPTSPTSPFAGS